MTEVNMNFNIEPSYVFHKEVAGIQNPCFKSLVRESLQKIPHYFFVVPASSSGKYHPKSSLGIGGLVRHVKAVCQIGEELLSHRLYAPFSDDAKDMIRVALILHDGCKQGIENNGSHTVMEHPLLVRNHLRPDNYISNTQFGEQQWSTICDLIETHMGIWTTDREGNQVLKEPETDMQKFVHLCDYLASRKSIEVDVNVREPQSEDIAQKKEPATERQLSYVDYLMKKAVLTGKWQGSVPMYTQDNLTKAQAMKLIEELRTSVK